MSCQHTQFEAEMAVNGYLSTFVHINHIVSTHWFWSSCVYFLFFFLPATAPSVLWMTHLSSGWLLTSFSWFLCFSPSCQSLLLSVHIKREGESPVVSPLSSDEAHHSDRYQVRLQTSERERVCHMCRLTDCAVLTLHTQTAETLSYCVGVLN